MWSCGGSRNITQSSDHFNQNNDEEESFCDSDDEVIITLNQTKK